MTSLKLAYGPMLLLLYQAAPITVERDSLGPYRITLGYSTGQWENESFDCNGSFVSATPVEFQSAGAELEAWPEPNVRVTAFGGRARLRAGQTGGDTTYGDYVEDYSGGFGGALLAVEGRYVGVGLGVTRVEGSDGFTGVAPYLRIGDIDRGHLRMEGLGPSAVFPAGGWARIGAGYNEGHRRGMGGFAGIGIGPVEYSSKIAFIGDLRVPLGRHLTAQVQGLAGPGELEWQWSTGFRLRYDFGRW